MTARFATATEANRATRALQRQLRLRAEDVGVTLAPGVDASELSGGGGYMGITKAGAVLVHARAVDDDLISRARAMLTKLGGTLVESEYGTASTGGYGPTTASGTQGVFGGPPGTSSMANHLFTQAPAEPEEELG